jgi:hypothetical protein
MYIYSCSFGHDRVHEDSWKLLGGLKENVKQGNHPTRYQIGVSADMITSKETGILGPLRPVWNTKKQE